MTSIVKKAHRKSPPISQVQLNGLKFPAPRTGARQGTPRRLLKLTSILQSTGVHLKTHLSTGVGPWHLLLAAVQKKNRGWVTPLFVQPDH